MAKYQDDLDPAADTQMFQAFVDRRELDEQEARTWGRGSQASPARQTRVVFGTVAAGLLIVLLLIWFVLAR
jgi:hypothetical protein